MSSFAELLLDFLPTERGGRESAVCLAEDAPSLERPQLRVRGGSELLAIEFVDGPDEPIVPGGSTYATVRFLDESQLADTLSGGAEIEVLDNGRVIATGRITRR